MEMSPIEILLVEDNPADVRLMEEALTFGKVANRISVVSNGKDAIDFLHRMGKYPEAIRPDIILLDLNLPKMDGREVLKEVKSEHQLNNIPIIVLTMSQEAQDIAKSYEQQANCYITKPVNFEEFVRVIKSLDNFWFSIVKLPPRGDAKWT